MEEKIAHLQDEQKKTAPSPEKFKEVALAKIPPAPSVGEAELLRGIRAYELPEPRHGKNQYRFAAEMVGVGKGIRARLAAAGLRDWRFDFSWIPERLLIDVQGGTHTGKGHAGGKGYANDCRKLCAAQLAGWTVLWYTTDQVLDATAIDELREFFRRKQHE